MNDSFPHVNARKNQDGLIILYAVMTVILQMSKRSTIVETDCLVLTRKTVIDLGLILLGWQKYAWDIAIAIFRSCPNETHSESSSMIIK